MPPEKKTPSQQDALRDTTTSRVNQILGIHDDEISTWRIFKIMAEFVEGFEFLKKYDKAVTFFGSARAGFDHEVYREARELAYIFAEEGYAVITGGGPGVMEAANQGAVEANGRSVGLNIKLPFEQRINPYVREFETFYYFFTRKVMLSLASSVYLFFPGGFGTLDEFFELVTLIQTKKIPTVPIVLVNKEHWEPLLDWIEKVIYEKNHAISKEDMDIYHLVDTAQEAYAYVKSLQ